MRTIDLMAAEAQEHASAANQWRRVCASDLEHASELRQPEPHDTIRPQLSLFD